VLKTRHFDLGDEFGPDTSNINDGYPILTAFADDSEPDESPSFSAFLIGYGYHCPATLVHNRLTNIGYIDKGTFNNATGSFASASTVVERSRVSDVVFIAGHGAHAASILVQDSDENAVELISAASGLTNEYWFQYQFRPAMDSQVVIGADFLSGSTTRTNSVWNDRTRWAILYTCSQLNFRNEGRGAYWNGLNNAQIWARTMLGYPNRMHGILGFYGVPRVVVKVWDILC